MFQAACHASSFGQRNRHPWEKLGGQQRGANVVVYEN